MLFRFPVEPQQTHKRVKVKQNVEFSDQDKAWLVINYTLPQVSPNAKEWTLEHALEVACVPQADREAMLKLPSTNEVRKKYATWLVERISKGVSPESQTPVPPARKNPVWFQRTCAEVSSSRGCTMHSAASLPTGKTM